MATALRPRLSASAISSRYGSRTLALGARVSAVTVDSVDTASLVAGFDGPESVDTSPVMAGFGTPSPGRPRPRTAVSFRQACVAFSLPSPDG